VIDEMRRFWNYADYFDAESEVEGLRNYYGLCSFLDDNIGRILTALDDSGQAGNTQILYTSDHGDMIGNHGIWCKSFMYEDSVGIPLTLSGPGIEPGVNPTPVTLNDVGATVELAVTGESPAPEQRWRARPLQHLAANPDPERPVLSEYHDGGSPCGSFMLRQGRWKYVYYAEGHPALLFDLEADPHELENLVASRADVAERMRTQLFDICDPEAVNRRAFADQAAMVEKLGGIDAIRAMASFNHTPVG
jgi:choline-sulfatase